MVPEIHLHAEFLMHVRSVTIHGTIKNKDNTRIQAYISSDQKTISLSCDDQKTSIALPSGVRVKGAGSLPILIDSENPSLRLEISEDDKTQNASRLGVDDFPWTASSLGPETVLTCRICHSTVISSGQRVWKDLPRGSWAETLDQWYCHRPEVNGVGEKEYTGSSGPQLKTGTAFIDACHFVFPPPDCLALKVRSISWTLSEPPKDKVWALFV